MKIHKSGTGVVLCDCGGTLAERLDFVQLRKSLAAQKDVAGVTLCSGFCRPAEAARVVQALATRGGRRMVIGACRRSVYEPALAAAMSKARLKNGLAIDANIREHCAWVHPARDSATTKAFDLIAAAVRCVAFVEPVTVTRRKALSNVVVLGGGLAGMQAAVRLAHLEHAVTLVTRAAELGGCAARFPGFFSYLGDDAAEAADLLKQEVDSVRARIQSDKRIRWIPRASLRSVSGEAGHFTVEIHSGDKEQALKAGALVLAVGAFAEFPFPAAACHPDPRLSERSGRRIYSSADESPLSARNDRITTDCNAEGVSRMWSLADLADILKDGRSLPQSVAIVVDFNGEQGRAVHALALSAAEQLAASQRRRVVLFCRQVRVAARGMESLYRRVRDAGAHIFRYEKDPTFKEQERGVMIRAFDTQAGVMVEESFDTVVMADERKGDWAGRLPLPRTLRRGPEPESAFQADNVWLSSAKSNQPGIYVVGAARGNSELCETQNDAAAAALAIHQLLGAGSLAVVSDAPVVDAEKCVLCLTCLRSCPHGAIEVDAKKEAAAMSAIACQRCGLCATLCPARAIQLPWCSDDQMAAALDEGPTVTVFACENSAWPAAESAGVGRRGYGVAVRLVRVPCAGRVDERQVLDALERGATRVLILGCHREACRYLVGADHAAKRVERLKAILAKAGLDPARIEVGHMTEFETGKFLDLVKR